MRPWRFMPAPAILEARLLGIRTIGSNIVSSPEGRSNRASWLVPCSIAARKYKATVGVGTGAWLLAQQMQKQGELS
jgi:hypothetical protein